MARSMNKNNSRNTKVEHDENIVLDSKEIVKSEEETIEKKEKKVFKNEDLIQCVSIVSGKLVLIGNKTGEKYVWDDIGDTQDVAYNDLMSEFRNRTSFVFAPWFIIQDKDFLEQHTEISNVYGGLYTPSDIEKVLTLPANEMKRYIDSMPIGARESLKDMAMTMINNGEFDSIQRIKVLDDYFGTNLLITLTK